MEERSGVREQQREDRLFHAGRTHLADDSRQVRKGVQIVVDLHLTRQGEHHTIGVELRRVAALGQAGVLELAVGTDLLEGPAGIEPVAADGLEVAVRPDGREQRPGDLDGLVARQQDLIGDVSEQARQTHRREPARTNRPVGSQRGFDEVLALAVAAEMLAGRVNHGVHEHVQRGPAVLAFE